MSKSKPRNLAASVCHRLTEVAHKQGEVYQVVLTRYVIERFLYRLSRSPYRDKFILKGAMLFQLWTDQRHRPTRDLDLLGKGNQSIQQLVEMFTEVCGLAVEEDGIVFNREAVRGEPIREDQEYGGVRIYCEARLGQPRIRLQIDIGFGDTVTPTAEKVTFPPLLSELPAPELRAYPQQTVVAEKFQAMVALSMANSRLKDFFDLWVLANHFEFDGQSLCRAIRATFQRRKTSLPTEAPLALTVEFGTNTGKLTQWNAFVRKNKLDTGGVTLEQVCAFLHDFLMPPTSALVTNTPFPRVWPRTGPWMP